MRAFNVGEISNLVSFFLQGGLDVLLAWDEGHGLGCFDVAFLESTQFVFLVGQVRCVAKIDLKLKKKI